MGAFWLLINRCITSQWIIQHNVWLLHSSRTSPVCSWYQTLPLKAKGWVPRLPFDASRNLVMVHRIPAMSPKTWTPPEAGLTKTSNNNWKLMEEPIGCLRKDFSIESKSFRSRCRVITYYWPHLLTSHDKSWQLLERGCLEAPYSYSGDEERQLNHERFVFSIVILH